MFFCLLFGCDKNNQNTKIQNLTQNKIKFDNSIIESINKYEKTEYISFESYYKEIINEDLDTNKIHIDGIVFPILKSDSKKLIQNMKNDLKSKGYSIFMIDNITPKLCMLKTTDKYEILKYLGTNGINYDIDTDSLITKIKELDKKYKLELVGASFDYCEFAIHNEPANWLKFAKEMYEFCPDIVEQGTETIEALAQEMKSTKTLYLWWD